MSFAVIPGIEEEPFKFVATPHPPSSFLWWGYMGQFAGSQLDSRQTRVQIEEDKKDVMDRRLEMAKLQQRQALGFGNLATSLSARLRPNRQLSAPASVKGLCMTERKTSGPTAVT